MSENACLEKFVAAAGESVFVYSPQVFDTPQEIDCAVEDFVWGLVQYLFNELGHDPRRALDNALFVSYDAKQVAEVGYHLKWVYDINNPGGEQSFYSDPAYKPERDMLARVALGRSSSYDLAFFMHERHEAYLVRQRGGYAADLDTAQSIQSRAHNETLRAQGNLSTDLYHPSVVGGSLGQFMGRAWKDAFPSLFK